MRRWGRRLSIVGLVLLVLLLGAGAGLWALTAEARGARATGARLERMQRSPAWRDGRFTNALTRTDGSPWAMTRAWLLEGSAFASPTAPIEVLPRRRADYDTPPASGLAVTWLGHSTLLLELDGHRVLIDPVWGERASPLSFLGPKRWYLPPLPLSELPDVDAVLISHDHYDHLDLPTVHTLRARHVRWFVPLGIGAHLEKWGVPLEEIVELDWWEEAQAGALTLTSVPARHFSGRGVDDQGQTLWTGWVVRGPRHRAYYSGDTAMLPAFAEIGERLGPFDLTMVEAGAYNALWADVHLGPEQAVMAHRMARGRVLLPVHWGMFDLALHAWTEPMERVLVAAERAGVAVLTPRPGERLEPTMRPPVVRWWAPTPWQTLAEAPAWSHGVDALLAANALELPGPSTATVSALVSTSSTSR